MRASLVLIACLLVPYASAQRPHQPSSAEILQGLEKLEVLGNVLYLAAHPDDENTRFLAYVAGEKHMGAAYLSLTRGDGGQNLIGPELREELGIIRTQELLAARRVDGAEQYFTRANDFGYSKTPAETLAIWDKDAILSDVVRVIRMVRPDVIVCRFPTDGGGGHGHHAASALLGLEAFGLAGDANAYPEQLVQGLEPWQPLRIVVNTGRWWKTDISADDPGVVALDVGAYNPVLGTSYTEIAARSRTNHKSQGFGSTGSRGEELEFFEHLAGSQAEHSLFDGVRSDWSRIPGGEAIGAKIQAVRANFDAAHPEASLPGLVEVHRALDGCSDRYWKARKRFEVEGLIRACAGLYLEAAADRPLAAPGEEVAVQLELVARNASDCHLVGIDCAALGWALVEDTALERNRKLVLNRSFQAPAAVESDGPYWLQETGTLGTYRVDDPALLGRPQNPPTLEWILHLVVAGEALAFPIPVIYKWNDPVQGERYRPFDVVPPVFVAFGESSYLFPGTETRSVDVVVKGLAAETAGTLQLTAGESWTLEPASIELGSLAPGEEQHFSVRVTPGSGAKPCELQAQVQVDGRLCERSLVTIDYEHIVPQIYLPRATTHLVSMDLQRLGQRIGYLPGAGDTIPEALRRVGYTVDVLTESEVTAADLAKYDAVITGIRLFNVEDRIAGWMPELLAYCEAGGTLVVQYNTTGGLKTDSFGPYPLTLSRDRVTEEDAPVRFLLPDHPVLHRPNEITQADFEGWVQERGLYFPGTWAQPYQAILSWNDTGESPKDGALLVATYGKGTYVYTGISFFRELPAGVPGAYRLLVNLLSLGHE